MVEPEDQLRSAHRRVVCAVDSNMVYALAVMLYSLSRSAQIPFEVTVGYLEETLDESDKRFIRGVLEMLTIPGEFKALPHKEEFISQGHISPTTFAKFLLADAIHDAHVWIDADTIALSGWDELFCEIDRCSSEQGLVVADRGGESDVTAPDVSSLVFNAGVLGWPQGARREWETPLASLPEVDTQEQFLFNQLYAHSALTVSEKFNYLTYRFDKLNPSDLPFIIHFAGAHKPWHLRRDLSQPCMTYHCPWSEWFVAEAELLALASGTELETELIARQRKSLPAASVPLRRDHAGYLFLKLLSSLGPVAYFVVNFMKVLKQWIPRGTHPIH